MSDELDSLPDQSRSYEYSIRPSNHPIQTLQAYLNPNTDHFATPSSFYESFLVIRPPHPS
jgi:hypothetical protein